jgi:hypothetical protein
MDSLLASIGILVRIVSYTVFGFITRGHSIFSANWLIVANRNQEIQFPFLFVFASLTCRPLLHSLAPIAKRQCSSESAISCRLLANWPLNVLSIRIVSQSPMSLVSWSPMSLVSCSPQPLMSLVSSSLVSLLECHLN